MGSHKREPIRHTCPDINKYISSIKAEITSWSTIDNMDHDQAIETAKAMNSELERCIGYLEELRSSNDTLRQWGVTESSNADEFETNVNVLEEEVEDLKNKVEELENEIEELKLNNQSECQTTN